MSFKPDFTAVLRRVTGPDAIPANSIIYSGEPCAVWFSRGRQLPGTDVSQPPIIAQVAMARTRFFVPPGWSGVPPKWNGRVADQFVFTALGSPFPTFSPVFAGFMWLATVDEHCRFDCTRVNLDVAPPQTAFFTGRSDGNTVVFDVYRPFGAAVPVLAGGVGVLYADTVNGRGFASGGNYYTWSHYLDVAVSLDIRDGMLRAGGLDTLTYSDGDEVRIPTPAPSTRYVVVFVAPNRALDGTPFHRVYLLRDQPAFPLIP